MERSGPAGHTVQDRGPTSTSLHQSSRTMGTGAMTNSAGRWGDRQRRWGGGRGTGRDGVPVRALFLLPGFADMPGVLRQCHDAGVRRVVLLSGSSVDDGDPDNAISTFMRVSEAAVRAAGIAWTILRPSAAALRGRVLPIPCGRHARRVGGVPDRVSDPRPCAACVRAVGHGTRRRFPLIQNASTWALMDGVG
jgi:hypothetical protein